MDLGPEAKYHSQEVIDRIYRLLEQEPEKTRNIVLMRLDGYSFYEIGTKFGISENSARVIDFRTKDKLRKILKNTDFDNEVILLFLFIPTLTYVPKQFCNNSHTSTGRYNESYYDPYDIENHLGEL